MSFLVTWIRMYADVVLRVPSSLNTKKWEKKRFSNRGSSTQVERCELTCNARAQWWWLERECVPVNHINIVLSTARNGIYMRNSKFNYPKYIGTLAWIMSFVPRFLPFCLIWQFRVPTCSLQIMCDSALMILQKWEKNEASGHSSI